MRFSYHRFLFHSVTLDTKFSIVFRSTKQAKMKNRIVVEKTLELDKLILTLMTDSVSSAARNFFGKHPTSSPKKFPLLPYKELKKNIFSRKKTQNSIEPNILNLLILRHKSNHKLPFNFFFSILIKIYLCA